ncbi:MAG: precorrin-6y C5,15-methyltransferase (decarboxylating) subunit CbiE, partial [Rhodospirillales bacterium]|nr:precorrin-6y C5,15-methyltransferase (decarboxylating) subunit CbiE [Rhodospirillales bacterium]
LALARDLIRGEARPWPTPMTQAFPALVALRPRPVAVLASGDPFCYGVGARLAHLVPANEMLCLPVPSAYSLACARLGWSLVDVTTLSLCGRPLATLIPHLQPGARLLVLSADGATPAAVADLLHARGFGESRLHVMEALGGPRERVRTLAATDWIPGDIDPLNLLAIELKATADALVLPLASGLADEFFEHDGQLTKQEVRAVTLAVLAPLQGELLWDVGAGSGSIGIEWLLCHRANRAIAIERRAERAARAARNAAALGVPRLAMVEGAAPDALAGLPPPDAAFIGGGAERPGVVEAVWDALRPGGRLVANAVTIETESVLFASCQRWGGTLRRIAVERLDALGTMHGFRPAMTVTQWAASKR